MKSYKDLIVWQKAMDLVVLIYELTSLFPTEEKFGLTSQLRRASVSIPSNIAEGYGRRNKTDNAHFLSIALGSGLEVQTQIILAERLQFCDTQKNLLGVIHSLLDEVLRMTYSYRKSLLS
jgi:four helix bundle protein